jgi:sulfur carrier protein ThiS adenylyltransferase
MSAEVLRIITAFSPETRDYYPTTLFAAEEAYQGSCTAKTTIYSSNVIAGIMVGQLAKHLRNLPLEADIIFNLLTCDVDVKDVKKELEKVKDVH